MTICNVKMSGNPWFDAQLCQPGAVVDVKTTRGTAKSSMRVLRSYCELHPRQLVIEAE